MEAVANLMKQLQSAKEEVKQKDAECRQQSGRLERLGSQLGVALVEAARASECAREAQTTSEVLRERLSAQEAAAASEISHVRALKAAMALRARRADRRAALSDSIQSELDATRQKLRTLRKEMNNTRVQLCLQVSDIDASDAEDDEPRPRRRNESLDAEPYGEDGNESSSAQDDAEEAALALKRLRAMPTWRAIREKGKRGQPKLEWGTRVTIYSLLSMLGWL